ncbi:TlpA disulfide reductase family protein [Croceiramulus getboli]|nr:TlpA disulfide reductase family protein [Flavobacteriaceae bacterium YJPT1-3]
MKNFLLLVLLSSLFCSCDTSTPESLKVGPWRVALEVQDGQELPFLMTVRADGTAVIVNAEERIEVDEIRIEADSIFIQTPVFEGVIKGHFVNDKEIRGSFVKNSLNRVVPITLRFGAQDRFKVSAEPATDVSGRWEAIFSPATQNAYSALGIFKQEGAQVTGTFRTETGDYRYLEGVLDGATLKLSTFDGAHAFLFTAQVTDSTLEGTFYSGNHFKEPFRAKRNPEFELMDEDSLTFLKQGYDRFSFAFPNAQGDTIRAADPRFKNKVALVQIMGTWCPNCLDETKFYVDYLKNHPEAQLEIVALAFEYAPTPEKAFASIQRLQDLLDIPYPILLAQYGTSDKQEAAKKLPMLNQVLSYPTTLYIDKNQRVRKIHTGFNGPATGDKYEEFKENFDRTVQQLLSE